MSKTIALFLSLFLFAVPAFAAKAKPAAATQVSFKTADGFTLVGEFYRGMPGKPAVLLLHQLGTDHTEFTGLAQQLQARGFNVLAYDARGHGKSTKKDGQSVSWESFDQAGFLDMTKDIEAALKFLREKEKISVARVGIVGASIQSSTGLIYASTHPAVRALVMLSPGLSYHGLDTTAPMKLYGDRPAFFAASTEDAPSYEAAGVLSHMAKGPKELEILSNAGHGAAMFKKEPGLQDKVTAWLLRYLK